MEWCLKNVGFLRDQKIPPILTEICWGRQALYLRIIQKSSMSCKCVFDICIWEILICCIYHLSAQAIFCLLHNYRCIYPAMPTLEFFYCDYLIKCFMSVTQPNRAILLCIVLFWFDISSYYSIHLFQFLSLGFPFWVMFQLSHQQFSMFFAWGIHRVVFLPISKSRNFFKYCFFLCLFSYFCR